MRLLSSRLAVLAVLLPLLGGGPWMAFAEEEEEPQSGLLPPAFIEPIKGLGEGPLFPAEKVDPIQPIQLEWDCFQYANDARANPAAYGYPSYSPAPPLHWNAALLTVAWTHSKDMYTEDYFAHESYDRIGGQLVFVSDMATRVRSYYTFNVSIAENIAWNTSGSAQGVIQQWMDSPPHRESLMNPLYTEGAIGAFGGSDKVYFTHNFGARTISHNLAIGGSDVTLDPASPNPGDTVRVRFTVHNTGATDAYPVEVRFYSRPTGGSWSALTGVLWMKYILEGGTAQTAYYDVDTTGLAYGTDIAIEIDCNNRFSETDETDNAISGTLISGGGTPSTPTPTLTALATPTPSQTPFAAPTATQTPYFQNPTASPTPTATGTQLPVAQPQLEWSTFVGGTENDRVRGMTVDAAGSVYLTGFTASAGWISGGWDDSYNGGESDGFVIKFSPEGQPLWSSYLGGSAEERGYEVQVDGSGNVIVAGFSSSPGWVSGGYDTSQNGEEDGFLVKLNSNGQHVWSTYVGGNDWDEAWGLEIDPTGNLILTGRTYSSGWISGGFDTTHHGELDAFVVKISPEGAPLWSTYLGGSDRDTGWEVGSDSGGNLYVTGYTDSAGWVSGGFDPSFNGGREVFVAKLSSGGAHLWSTYLGGSGDDEGYSLAVDSAGNVHVCGMSLSSGWVSGGYNPVPSGGEDSFVAKLDPSGALSWSTFLGGNADDVAEAIAVDDSGNVFVTGLTGSAGWVSGGFDSTQHGALDGFVAKLTPTGWHHWSTYLGGSEDDVPYCVVWQSDGTIWCAGTTYSPMWPSGGYDVTYNGNGDSFLAKIQEGGAVPSNWTDCNRSGLTDCHDLLLFLSGASVPPPEVQEWVLEFSAHWERP